MIWEPRGLKMKHRWCFISRRRFPFLQALSAKGFDYIYLIRWSGKEERINSFKLKFAVPSLFFFFLKEGERKKSLI